MSGNLSPMTNEGLQVRSMRARKAVDVAIKSIASVAALLGIVVLFWILYVVIRKGAAAINWDFFTKMPAPPGVSGGGLASALVGTLWMTLIASAIGIPLGMLAGSFLAEFGTRSRFGNAVRFATNVMMGVPSIIVGLFIYALIVVPSKQFSGWAGSLALAILMLPVVARTTEDMLTMVPDSLRESALALGATRTRVTYSVVFRAAKSGIITGILLAMSRVAGETAPLLFTALNSPYWPESLSGPTSNLTVTIFNYAMSPYDDWQRLAWGASLVITMTVLLLSVTARVFAYERKR
ncbi:MAG: phosphate ABC transporter permease PstA [Myxococcales bacterium]|nr:phosphate ABC transporter permease PstA [Myxococcales bacterium]